MHPDEQRRTGFFRRQIKIELQWMRFDARILDVANDFTGIRVGGLKRGIDNEKERNKKPRRMRVRRLRSALCGGFIALIISRRSRSGAG